MGVQSYLYPEGEVALFHSSPKYISRIVLKICFQNIKQILLKNKKNKTELFFLSLFYLKEKYCILKSNTFYQ